MNCACSGHFSHPHAIYLYYICLVACITGPNQFEAASEFIKLKFVEKISNKRKKVYPFITNATNTDNFKNIFGAVKDIVVTQMMQTVGVGI